MHKCACAYIAGPAHSPTHRALYDLTLTLTWGRTSTHAPWPVQHEQTKNMADRWIDTTEAETEDSDATTCEDLSCGWVHELIYDYLVHNQPSSLEPPGTCNIRKCPSAMNPWHFLWLHQPAVNNLVGGGGGFIIVGASPEIINRGLSSPSKISLNTSK